MFMFMWNLDKFMRSVWYIFKQCVTSSVYKTLMSNILIFKVY